MERIYDQIEKALVAKHGFVRDRDYVIDEKQKVNIVDESTGRVMEGRKWQDGLHQAVEAKEQVPVTAATGQAARVTVQSFFRLYEHLCGMTGTASAGAGRTAENVSAEGVRHPDEPPLHFASRFRHGSFRPSQRSGRPWRPRPTG